MLVLTGVKNAQNDPKLEKGEHIAFDFTYHFDNYGKVKPFDIPSDVVKLIR